MSRTWLSVRTRHALKFRLRLSQTILPRPASAGNAGRTSEKPIKTWTRP
jgi:hypothetical protein